MSSSSKGSTSGYVPVPIHSRLGKCWRRVPSWLVLPLACAVVVSFLLIFILPVYFSFDGANNKQLDPLYWPPDADSVSALVAMDQFNIALTLTGISPDSRSLTYLGGISAGGVYANTTSSGLLNLGGNSLSVRIGGVGFVAQTGDAVGASQGEALLTDITPLYNYPFDKYDLSVQITVSIVNISDPTNFVVEAQDTGLYMLKAVNGWSTQCTTSPRRDPATGAPLKGLVLTLVVQRSTAVKFFSMFIVILMWVVSLCVFVISIGFVASPSLDMEYDVPALSVGLLFALPFVRDVQPDVPDVGVTIDVFGYFWNILLIAVSTAMTLTALTVRYHRGRLAEARAQAAERGDGMLAASASGSAEMQQQWQQWQQWQQQQKQQQEQQQKQQQELPQHVDNAVNTSAARLRTTGMPPLPPLPPRL